MPGRMADERGKVCVSLHRARTIGHMLWWDLSDSSHNLQAVQRLNDTSNHLSHTSNSQYIVPF